MSRARDEAEPGPAVEVPIGPELDLHTFAPRDLEAVVRAYLDAAALRGLREVRLVHGKGRGVQRARIHRLLSEHPHVLRFREAPPAAGGWGATLAWLRAGPPEPRS
jgi:DNA-nicking Smr family endonuclease